MCDEGQRNLKEPEQNKKQRGQLVIEYILLMMFSVAIATLIKTQFIGGDAEDPEDAGLMTQLVYKIAQPIATDTPGD